MRIEKFITDGGDLTLAEIYQKFKISATVVREVLDGLYPEVKSTKLGGHTEKYPRLQYHGIHLLTPEEMAKKADVAFMVATQIEFDTIAGILASQEELTLSSPDIKRVVVGHRGDTICLIGQAMEKRAIRAYGTAMALFTLAASCRFFFKVGGAAGRYEIGTITVLCRGPNGIVLHDWYMKEDVKEGQNFPSPTALNFSYEQVEGLLVGRSSATCGPEEIHDYDASPDDTYEWEFSGVRIAANSSFFHGELGMISVITDNYGLLNFNSVSVIQAFEKLADYVGKFIDSNLLA